MIGYSDHIEGEGVRMFELVVKKDMEGIIAKDATSRYLAGQRTTLWRKIKITAARKQLLQDLRNRANHGNKIQQPDG